MLLKNKVTFEELKVVKTAQPHKGVQLLHPVSLKIITPYKRLQLKFQVSHQKSREKINFSTSDGMIVP